jgi:hypothetical protein
MHSYHIHSILDEPRQLSAAGNFDQQAFGLFGPNGEDKGLRLPPCVAP